MNGLKAEEVFREALQKAGFWVLWHQDLDHEHQVDCVLGAPPGMRCFPQAVAVQFTTFPDNWEKRTQFARASASLTPRRAFVEVTLTHREFGPELLQPLMAAMLALLYSQKSQPSLALVRVSANEFAISDLEEKLRHHVQLVAVPTDQQLRGRITYWKQTEGYGFITAVISAGSDGKQGTVSFFVHRSRVTPEVLGAVQSFDGHIPWNNHVPVSFASGGIPQGRNRPSALDARLVNETTASLALVKA